MLNLLYVEDDAYSREVVRMALRMSDRGFSLTTFEDSEDFECRLLKLEPKPDLILLDIHVKPHTGFEMLALIRAIPRFHTTPVVALTASVMNEEIQMLQTAGFDGAVSKPLNMDEFPDLIQRIMTGERVWYIW